MLDGVKGRDRRGCAHRAIIGGKKGAAIGAGVGAGAGTGVVLSTRGEELVLPEGTQLRTILARALTVVEQQE